MENPPGFLGDATLRRIADKSSDLPGCDRLCVHLSNRLAGLYPIVSRLDGDRWASDWSNYCNTACGFLQMLRVQLSRTELLFRLATSNTVACYVRYGHDRVSSIYQAIGVTEDEACATAWRESWSDDQSHQVSFLADAIEDMSPKDIIQEFTSPMKLEETLAELHKQIQTHQGADSSISTELLELMTQVWTDVSRIKGELLPQELYEWFVLADAVEVESPPIGEGMISKIYRGTWASTEREGIIAVKKLSKTDAREVFSSEISVWWGLEHDNILKLLGANHIVKRKMFVCEFANAGNFAQFFGNDQEKEETAKENRKRLWSLFAQAAEGLAYLHRKRVEYGGLKCNNLLLHREKEDSDLVVKLSDFGFSHIRTQSVPVSTDEKEDNVRWKAPESLGPSNGEPVEFFKSDVYSLGLCIIEAVTSEPPFGMMNIEEIIKFKTGRLPIERPVDAFSDAEWDLVSSMVDPEPSSRPTIDTVITTMNELDGLLSGVAVSNP